LKRAFGLALILALLGAAHEASADAYDAALTRAVAAKETALDVNEPARWLEALRLFREADEIRSSGETKYELGFAAAQLRQFDLAVESYDAAIELGLGDAARERAKKFVAEHASAMARLLVTGPAGTELYIADMFRGRLPIDKPLIVFSGVVEVEARSAHDATRHSVHLNPGALGTLSLEALAAGKTAEITSADGPQRPEQKAREREPDRAASSSNGPWILVSAGAGLALLGAVMVPVSNGRIDAARAELDPLCAVPDGPDSCLHAEPDRREAAQDRVDRIASWKAARVGAFVTAGVGTATLVSGIVMLVSRPPSRPNPAAITRPIGLGLPTLEASGDRFGLTLHGAF